MDKSINTNHPLFILKAVDSNHKVKASPFTYGRIIIGRVESCDIIIPSITVSAVHSVLEINKNKIKIYDMNSTNGTFVNNKSVVSEEIKIGDKLKFADVEFILSEYVKSAALPPVLELLEPEGGSGGVLPNIPENLPSTNYGKEDVQKVLPVAPKLDKSNKDEVPYVVYPLASDPKAEFSEYIFEDVDTLYPIFKYEIGRSSIEVIILYNDSVHSVDYLPCTKGSFNLVGTGPRPNDVEFVYLGKNDKLPFVDVVNDEVHVHKLADYELLLLADDKQKSVDKNSASFLLSNDDIVRFKKSDIEIFIRKVSAPPKVASAPFFRRDKEFRKYIFLMFLLILLPLIGLQNFEVDEELEKEKAPERIATILYKRKLVVSQNKAVEKTDKALKEVQKTPSKKETPKKEEPKKIVKKAAPEKTEAKEKPSPKKPGKKTEKVVRDVRKGLEKPVNRAKTLRSVRSTNPKPGASAKSAASATTSTVKSVNQGRVDTYKSVNFKSTVSNLLSKGGAFKSTKSATGSGSSALKGANVGGGSAGGLKSADIAGPVGSLTGATTGRFDTSKGAEGLSDKRSIYTAGIPSETVILGSMDPDIIRQILKEHIPQFRYCYQKELESNTDASGVVRLNFVIGASGHVSKASVAGSGIPVNVRKCVGNVLRGIQFPSPKGGGNVEVKQPINFQAKKIN